MGDIILLEDVYCERVLDSIIDMATILENDGVAIDFTVRELKGILHQFYQLYESKRILYSYQEDMQSYFATIFTNVSDYGISNVSFSTIMDGFFQCYNMMSPVEVTKNDFQKTKSAVQCRFGCPLPQFHLLRTKNQLVAEFHSWRFVLHFRRKNRVNPP